MKKILFIVLSITLGLTLIGCGEENEIELIQSDDQVLAIEAISSSMLLSYHQTSVQAMSSEETDDPVDEEVINEIDQYVDLIETFLANQKLVVESQTSDNENYQYLMLFQTMNIYQEEVTYRLYYNIIVLDEEEETTETQNLNYDKRFHDEDDHLVNQLIEGILIMGDDSYEIEGKILEVNGKTITRLRSFIDDSNYVLVNYQVDERGSSKEKFFFQVVQNDQVISRSRIMIFNQDRRQHLLLEFIEGEDYLRFQFHSRERNGVEYIHINYSVYINGVEDEGNIRLTKTVNEETNEVVYDYAVTPNKGNPNQYQRNHQSRNPMNESNPRYRF